jgi:hypothetical protein
VMAQQAALFQELLRQSAEREKRLHEELTELRRTPAAANSAAPGASRGGFEQLSQFKDTFALVREVLQLADGLRSESGGDGDDEGAGNLVRILREAKGLAASFAAAGAAPTTPSSAPAASNPPRLQAPPQVADAGRKRVEQFVQAVFAEAQLDSDPAAAAEQLEQAASMLPSQVREAIATGEWRTAWPAFTVPLGGPLWSQLDAALQNSEQSKRWLAEFVAELAALWQDDEADNDDLGDDDSDETIAARAARHVSAEEKNA